MRFKWIVLLVLLMLPVMIADIDTSMKGPDSSGIAEKWQLARSNRFKRGCCCGYPCRQTVIVVQQKSKATGQKEMFRNWWLHISLLLLSMSASWIKGPLS